MPEAEFWLTCGSTYTYLALSRLDAVERASGVRFTVRPFNLGVIFAERNYFPFPPDAPKTRYMWRDIERRAKARGLPVSLPVPYPAPQPNVRRANEAAHFALRHDWGRAYLLASYRAWFGSGLGPGTPENMRRALAEAGQDADAVLAAIEAENLGGALDAATERAKALGIFGAPTFVVGGELFWGDDRLEDAVDWARGAG
jgi:2-hydroxychromene-2-carboxylate isomerase